MNNAIGKLFVEIKFDQMLSGLRLIFRMYADRVLQSLKPKHDWKRKHNDNFGTITITVLELLELKIKWKNMIFETENFCCQ